MKSFFTIVKSDYLQRTRSYAFLVTLCISLAVAYSFVPEPNAGYSTIRISNHVGYYNSAWFGYVTAIMTSIFLSLAGFYLVNSGIQTDIETKVGQIFAATPIKNTKYLLSKAASNFLVLLTIVLSVLLVSILLFFLYNDGYPFEPTQFLRPYLIITIPSIVLVSVLAVAFEVVFRRHSIIQNIIYFFLFITLLVSAPTDESQFTRDVLGSKIVTNQMEKIVQESLPTKEKVYLAIGFVPSSGKETKRFLFSGIDFPIDFIVSRLLWVLLGIGFLMILSPLFHRFDIKKRVSGKKPKTKNYSHKGIKDIVLSSIPKPQIGYGILPLVKTEVLLLIRRGRKWLWVVNLIGMLLLAFMPLKFAHQFVLPILWFLQVARLSELTTKEINNNVHYFAFSSYKPLSRLLLSQLFAGIALMLALASPLLIRFALQAELGGMLSVAIGGIFIVLLASFIGILTKGKKLFEILFFLVTYANINAIVSADYFGAMPHNSMYLATLLLICGILIAVSFVIRKFELDG